MEFEVAMDGFVLAYDLEGPFELQEDASDLLFGEGALVVFLDVFVEVCVSTVLKDQIKIMSGLFKIKETYDVGVLHQLQHPKLLLDPL